MLVFFYEDSPELVSPRFQHSNSRRNQEHNQHKVNEAITGHVECTISDRAAVNKCVTVSLQNILDKDLALLNSNVHPLESMAG